MKADDREAPHDRSEASLDTAEDLLDKPGALLDKPGILLDKPGIVLDKTPFSQSFQDVGRSLAPPCAISGRRVTVCSGSRVPPFSRVVVFLFIRATFGARDEVVQSGAPFLIALVTY